jgi:phosphatidylserine/phosphatidylglycerophosphate/cardiolipin synthase-like enzyme
MLDDFEAATSSVQSTSSGFEDHFNDGRFHDLFVRVTGSVVGQLQLVFLASFRWLGGDIRRGDVDARSPRLPPGSSTPRRWPRSSRSGSAHPP